MTIPDPLCLWASAVWDEAGGGALRWRPGTAVDGYTGSPFRLATAVITPRISARPFRRPMAG